jgi:hypothetical protein
MSEITIQGLKVPLEDKYAPGHQIDLGEARALNQLRRENLRNNFGPRVKAAVSAAVPEEALQDMFKEYAQAYSFSTNPGERNAMSKLEYHQRALAKEALGAIMKRKGLSMDEMSPDHLEVAIATLIRERPSIREEALARVQTADASVADMLDDTDLDELLDT